MENFCQASISAERRAISGAAGGSSQCRANRPSVVRDDITRDSSDYRTSRRGSAMDHSAALLGCPACAAPSWLPPGQVSIELCNTRKTTFKLRHLA